MQRRVVSSSDACRDMLPEVLEFSECPGFCTEQLRSVEFAQQTVRKRGMGESIVWQGKGLVEIPKRRPWGSLSRLVPALPKLR